MPSLIAKLWAWWRPRARQANPPYRVFTRDFDQIVRASELDAVLGPLSRTDQISLNEAWKALQGALQGWRTNLHLAALEASSRIRSTLDDEARADTVVTILIDHSGSMRGQRMLLAAAAADVAQNFISLLGSAVEVLGFTTVTWHGGKSRRRWQRAWRSSQPGRLCDLLHIIYRTGDDTRSGTGGFDFKPMLRPDLPKENIDGEALEWAAARLRTRPEKRKILLIISDGAPVDDSTLKANDPAILDRHLRQVIGTLEASTDMAIAAIGIGFDASRYYSNVATIETPHDLGATMIALLEKLIGAQKSDTALTGDTAIVGDR